MKVLLHPTYFPSIAHWALLIQADEVVFEVHDNYQKQTFRNRTRIAGPNGIQHLNVPVNYSQTNRTKTSGVYIDNSQDWRGQHLKSLATAYNKSPFFEFYSDQIQEFFRRDHKHILDLAFSSIDLIKSCLNLNINSGLSSEYSFNPDEQDFRFLADHRQQPSYEFPPYIQVFSEKYSFESNLGILDLLFNEGPNSLNYLRTIQISKLIPKT